MSSFVSAQNWFPVGSDTKDTMVKVSATKKRSEQGNERENKGRERMSKLMSSDAFLPSFSISFIFFLLNVSKGHFSCLFYPQLTWTPLLVPLFACLCVSWKRAAQELWSFNNSDQLELNCYSIGASDSFFLSLIPSFLPSYSSCQRRWMERTREGKRERERVKEPLLQIMRDGFFATNKIWYYIIIITYFYYICSFCFKNHWWWCCWKLQKGGKRRKGREEVSNFVMSNESPWAECETRNAIIGLFIKPGTLSGLGYLSVWLSINCFEEEEESRLMELKESDGKTRREREKEKEWKQRQEKVRSQFYDHYFIYSSKE